MPLGFDHAGYVKRLKAVVAAITNNQAELQVILCQMVKFVKNGEPLKMSKRAGNFITAAQVVEEVGADVLRFIMLTRKNDAPFDFDLAKVIEQSKDNPVFYVQYAHARCCSVLRNLDSEMPDLAYKINESNCCEFSFEESKLDKLHEAEINLMVKIANFPRIVEMAVNSYEPHRIAFYLQELSAEFHSFWNLGSGNKSLKFIVSGNENQTKFRICMVLAVKKVISAGLEIFNISPANSM
jgi:arginyl-tRNA synthetase